MVAIISGVIQIIYLLLKNKFEQDEVEKKRKESLHAEVKEAILSHDAVAIHTVIKQLRG